jgi:hypothetical protein
VGGRIILKWILEKQNGVVCTKFYNETDSEEEQIVAVQKKGWEAGVERKLVP